MSNNLKNIEKNLRAFAKRTKDVKYTKSLLFSFLLMGMLSFSNTLTSPEVKNTENAINQTRKELNTSIKDLHIAFKQAKRENNRLLKNANLELIQLMEQGDQVVKSPWSSWQWGVGYYYNNWRGTYKGKGDKKEKYPFEGIFVRDGGSEFAEMSRYVSVKSDMYGFLTKGSSLTSAANYLRSGQNSTYGLASVENLDKGIVNIVLNASITPRDVGKQSPSNIPTAPKIVLPSFSPRLIAPPIAPEVPQIPTPAIAAISIVVLSSGNGEGNVIMGNGSNGRIQSVSVSEGDFKIVRTGPSSWTYNYSNYSGSNAFPIGNTRNGDPGIPTVAPNGTWSGLSGSGSGGGLGFQSIIGQVSTSAPDAAFLTNGTFLYTREFEQQGSSLGEFVHQDVHGSESSAVQRPRFVNAINNGAGTSLAAKGPDILEAYDEVVATSAIPNMHTWINSGEIVIEGGNTSLTNTYTHGPSAAQVSINTGKVIFQPYEKTGRQYKKYTAVFVISNDTTNYTENIKYNGKTGSIQNYTINAVGTVADGANSRKIRVINRGEFQFFGEESAGIYIKRAGDIDLRFVTADFALDVADPTNNTVQSGAYKPMQLFGDGNIGYYNVPSNGNSITGGHFAVDIGAMGKGNQTFSTAAVSGRTAGEQINDLNINPTRNYVTRNSKLLIEDTFGIISSKKIDLTSHQIRIYDKTAGNVGIYPSAPVELNIGGGNILIEGANTTDNPDGTGENIGIYIDGKGSVNSTGDITLNNGFGNIAVFSKGGGAATDGKVTVRKINANNTKNSIVIYGAGGASIDASELNIAGAGVENDASTVNGKDTGAVFATGAGTKVKIDRAAIPTTGNNISITGTKLTDASRYVGFGLLAEKGSEISAKNNAIKITDGSTGVASIGKDSTNKGSKVDLTGGAVDYTGEGYALYVKDGGQIDFTNATLTLRGKAVGFEKDLGASTPPIITTGMNINVFSNDVTVVDLKNVSSLALTNLHNNLTATVGIGAINSTDPSTGTSYNNYKLAVIDGLNAYNLDKNLDKSIAAVGGTDADADTFTKNLLVQRAKLNLITGNNVTAHLNSNELTQLGESTVVGLAMNSSTSATSNNETQINLQTGTTISADRTDAGAGAVGLFINYGEANIDNGAVLNVEKHTANAANDGAVGIYAINGSKVNNQGSISVGGGSSIGILGLSYRTDSTGALVKDEFGPLALHQGNVDVNNAAGSSITMDGNSAVGVYVENNDTAAHTVKGINSGTITISGVKGVGMAGKNFGALENAGNILITADEGVGMYGASSGALINSGIISVGDSSSETVLRIGMFTEDQNVTVSNSGTINAGKNSYGIYGKDIQLLGSSVLNIGENGVGAFSTTGTPTVNNIDIHSGATFNIGDNEAVGVFVENTPTATQINDAGSNMNIGKGSYGYVLKGTGTVFNNTNTGNITLKDSSVYLYSTDTTGNITNNANLSSTGNSTYGLYSSGTVNNHGNMNFTTGIGNVGIYSTNGGTGTNYGTISVGESDPSSDRYAIGMAAGFNGDGSRAPFTANIKNEGIINVNSASSIGMYGTGNGTTVYNGTAPGSTATINLNADGAIGMYLDKNAKGYNYGTITTVGTPAGAVGVSVKDNAEFINYGVITIDSPGGMAAFNDGGKLILRNYGTVNLGSGAILEGSPSITPTSTAAGGVEIIAEAGATSAIIKKDGIVVNPIHITVPESQRPILSSGLGMYIDTLRGTNPIRGLNSLALTKADLIIGAEAAEVTNSKYIQVHGDILKPYVQTMNRNPQISDWNIYSGSLIWLATVTRENGNGAIENVYLAKIPYTAYAGNQPTPVEKTDTYNFLDGLEKRYGIEGIDTREKALFNKLNKIGNNEEVLFYQAVDQMMGHQYANVQQRINSTSILLNKEFDNIRKMHENTSKKSNRITAFGTKGEYNTDTAGIINYTNNAYGVAYVHENETIKLGNSTGWYAGAVNNRFKFKDIGKSKENTTMLKLGIFKSKAFDHNGSLNWTISGEGFAARSEMERKYLIVDEIFKAKSTYNTYGLAVKNEISKEFRTGEKFSIKPYGSLKLEYGKFGTIKEKNGEMRLEVKGNDYFSVKPEIGAEFKYRHAIGERGTFTAALGLGYENELGKVANVKNKAKVAYTDAEYFNIRSEKDDRKGNFKADLNIGIDNQRFGLTFNAGYDTKGKNIRGGIGFRAIY